MSISQHILVATDFSDAAEAALSSAASLASELHASITLCHVLDPAPFAAFLAPTRSDENLDQVNAAAHEALDALLVKHFADVQLRQRVLIHHSDAALGIVDYASAHNIDLIVLATQGRSGIARVLIGSVAEKTVRHAACPVLTIPASASSAEGSR